MIKKERVKKDVMKEALFGIFVMAVMVASVTIAFVLPVSAGTVPATQFVVNYDNTTILLDGNTSSVLVGHEIQFYNRSGGPSGVVTLNGVSGSAGGDEPDEQRSDSNGRFDRKLKEGTYVASSDASGCNNTNITVDDPYMDLDLKKGRKSIKSIPRGSNFTIDFSTNLDPNDGVSLEVTDPRGYPMPWNPADGTIFDKVNVSHVTDLEIDTTGWIDLGIYTFVVSTEEGEYARGLKKKSKEEELEVVRSELKIKVEKPKIVEFEQVKLTVTGVPDHNIFVSIERGAEHATFPGGYNPIIITNSSFEDMIDADGKREYVVYFSKTGSYTVKVEDSKSDEEDYVDISVSKKKVTFSEYMPETCVIGTDLVLNGTTNTGTTIDIAIENVIVMADIQVDKKGEFEVKLPTPATQGTGVEGAIKIKAFIDTEKRDFSRWQDVSGVEDDGSIMLWMIMGSLSAESSASIVPPGDSFTLRGIASGSKAVDILIVAPKGGGGEGMNPTNSEANGLPHGIVYETASVSRETHTWSVGINVLEDADKGTYLVFVLSPGKNNIYDEIGTAELLDGIETKYFGGDLSKLAGKTQEQIKSIFLDATTGAAGSDDFMEVLKIKIGMAEVALNSISDVVIGDELVITGISNREGHSIIVKVKGPIDLGIQFARVENGKFKVNFSTSDALTGGYTVEADDGEGHTDTTTVNIVTPVRTLASPTPVPTTTPASTTSQEMPTPASTPTTQPENASTSTSSKLPLPGFETVFVITALLVVPLFFVCETRRRRK